MLRRRRPKKEAIQFSFDSFLDLVTNVVGIIIRLIMVTWVGARSYHASMQWVAPKTSAAPTEQLAPLPPPKITDEPLYSKLEIAKREIEDAKARLIAQIKDLELAEEKTKQTQTQFFTLNSKRAKLETELKSLAAARRQRGAKVQLASLSVEEIRQRTKKMLEEIKTLEATPSNRRLLKYHAPVSRTVHNDEVFFECGNGRVTFFDLPAFMLEIQQSRERNHQELRNQWRVEHTTAPVGPYRLRYTMERERTPLEPESSPSGNYYRSSLSSWVLEPITPERGETLEKALAPKSEFRQLVDPLDGNLTVVTFWVYPDSFDMFRQLRDYLYERGLDVAGRPLPPGGAIAASREGTASRGQ